MKIWTETDWKTVFIALFFLFSICFANYHSLVTKNYVMMYVGFAFSALGLIVILINARAPIGHSHD